MRERNVIINIRVTDKEKKALERSAKRAGLSLSAFLRKAGLNERIFVKPSAFLFKAYEATERLLKKFPSFSKSDIEVSKTIENTTVIKNCCEPFNQGVRFSTAVSESSNASAACTPNIYTIFT